MSFQRAFQWYQSHADPIWPDGTFNFTTRHYINIFFDYERIFIWEPSSSKDKTEMPAWVYFLGAFLTWYQLEDFYDGDPVIIVHNNSC